MKPILLTLILPLIIAPLTSHAKEKTSCQHIFAEFSKNTQLLIREMAEFHMAATRHENTVVKSAADFNFRTRFKELAERMGPLQAKQALRVQLAKMKSGDPGQTDEQILRRSQRRRLGPIVFNPKLLKRINGQSMQVKIDDGGFPDGSFEFKRLESAETERALWTDAAPYLEFKELRVPGPQALIGNQAVAWWKIHEAGSRPIGIGTNTLRGRTADLWIWDISKGHQAVWNLPMSDHFSVLPDGYAISPNGKYVITFDPDGKVHRLNLDRGKIESTEEVRNAAGIWVQDDGSVVAWLKNGERLAFSRDLTKKQITNLPTPLNTSRLNPLVRAVPSPDQTQALVFDDQLKNVHLADLVSGTIEPQHFWSKDKGKILWRKNKVWTEGSNALGSIHLNKSSGAQPEKNIYIEKDLVAEPTGRFAAGMGTRFGSPRSVGLVTLNGATATHYLKVADFDDGKTKTFHLDTEVIKDNQGWPSLIPVISPDGRLVAVRSRSTTVTIYDVESEKSIGEINLEKALGIAALPRWSPDGLMLMIEALDERTDTIRSELWSLDGGEQ